MTAAMTRRRDADDDLSEWEGLNPPYATIVADPPWSYKTTHITTAAKRASTRPDAIAKYSTTSATDIASLKVTDLAAENAHLYLWITNPLIFDGRDVMEAWGLRYVTLITWLKTGTMGMGYFRGDTEHVLFGVRGDAPIPPAKRERNWLTAAKRGHSIKPPAFFDLVEKVSPGPYVELFARSPRLGWDSWGLGYESRIT